VDSGIVPSPTFELLREQQRHSRAAAHGALKIHDATRLLGEPTHHRQTESRAAALCLGREERLEDALRQLRRNPGARVGDTDGHVVATPREPPALCVRLGDLHTPHVDGDATLAFDGIARIHGQIHDDALELRRARTDGARVGLKGRFEHNAGTERSTQQWHHAFNDLGRIDDLGGELLAPRESQKLLDEVRATFGRVARRLELLEDLGLRTQFLADEIQVADEDGEQVVEVVRDPSRQASESLHARCPLRECAEVGLLFDGHEHTRPPVPPAALRQTHIAAQRRQRTAGRAHAELQRPPRRRRFRPRAPVGRVGQ
jgi:hypothetical protein